MRPVARLAVVVIILLGFSLWAPGAAPGQGDEAQAPRAAVEAIPVVSREIIPTSTVLGTLEPRRRSIVATAIEGYVIEYPANEGQKVTAGQVLARLRDRELRIELDVAKKVIEEARELHRLAAADLSRAQTLVAKDAVTQKALDAAVTEERTLSLRIPQAEARAELLQLDIDKKQVTAPFDGQIVEEHTEVGEWLARGGPVATLVDLETVRVRINVPERHIRFLEPGAELPVLVPATGRGAYHGEVLSVSGEGDPESRTFPVLVEIENDGRLRAGMSARAEVPAGEPRKAVVVPKDAIIVRGTQSLVYIVGEGNRAELRPIVTGAASGSDLAVESGLDAGELVVIRGNERLQPGAPVRVLAPSAAETSQK